MVDPDGAAGGRAVVRAVGTQLPRLDHRQRGRQAVHERVDARTSRRATTCTAASTARAPGPGENIPAWLVFDQQYRDRYIFAGLQPGQRIPKKWLESGVIVKADTLEELATKAGLPADALTATVERFNGFARSGIDEDFHRGESAYDRYYGDPTNKPNPNLGEISHAPYYAAKMVPGDLGTKGGIRTDVHARALRDDGSVIEGLYAAGNVSAPVMGHTYPGPGGTIGPAMTFGYLAALHIAGKS